MILCHASQGCNWPVSSLLLTLSLHFLSYPFPPPNSERVALTYRLISSLSISKGDLQLTGVSGRWVTFPDPFVSPFCFFVLQSRRANQQVGNKMVLVRSETRAIVHQPLSSPKKWFWARVSVSQSLRLRLPSSSPDRIIAAPPLPITV